MAYNPLNPNSQATMANSQPIVIASNQSPVSVAGTLGASVIGLPTVQTGNNSVITLIQGSVAVSVTPPANQSVSGTVGASVLGILPVTVVGSSSVITVVQSSIAVNIISGSVAATFTPPANQSVSGTVGASVIGTVPVTQVTSPWTVVSSIAGGIFPVSGSVAATVTNTVTVVSSIAGGIFPISGSVAAVITNTPNVTPNFSSIIAINAGSVIAIIPGSVITVWKDSSVLAVPVGSTITVWQASSIVGTYAEDAGHTSGDKGIFVLGIRNDTMSSVTSADVDYSAQAVGPVGEVLVANSPITKWVYGTTSIVSGPSVALIAAQGASIFTYVTGLNIVNPSANNLTGNLSTGAGAASILVYWTAPANGGSNMIFPNPLRSRDNTAILASISGVGSVYLSAQGFISKT